MKTIYNKKIDFFFIQFPIIFPFLYGLILFGTNGYETILVFLLQYFFFQKHILEQLWPILFYSFKHKEFLSENVQAIAGSLFIIISASILFFYLETPSTWFFLFLTYFVTKQSFGICKLFNGKQERITISKYLYLFS